MRVKDLCAWLEDKNPEAMIVVPASDHHYCTTKPAENRAELFRGNELGEYFGEEYANEERLAVVDVIVFGA